MAMGGAAQFNGDHRPPGSAHVAAAMSLLDWMRIGRRLHLSQQQTDILRLLLGKEMTIGEIARTLAICDTTVRTQIVRMYDKLGVSCRLGLANRVYNEIIAIWIERVSG